MKANDPVTVYTLNDAYLAESIRNRLRCASIFCKLDGSRRAGLLDFLEIDILVPAHDVDRACSIIRRHMSRCQEHRGPGAI